MCIHQSLSIIRPAKLNLFSWNEKNELKLYWKCFFHWETNWKSLSLKRRTLNITSRETTQHCAGAEYKISSLTRFIITVNNSEKFFLSFSSWTQHETSKFERRFDLDITTREKKELVCSLELLAWLVLVLGLALEKKKWKEERTEKNKCKVKNSKTNSKFLHAPCATIKLLNKRYFEIIHLEWV